MVFYGFLLCHLLPLFLCINPNKRDHKPMFSGTWCQVSGRLPQTTPNLYWLRPKAFQAVGENRDASPTGKHWLIPRNVRPPNLYIFSQSEHLCSCIQHLLRDFFWNLPGVHSWERWKGGLKPMLIGYLLGDDDFIGATIMTYYTNTKQNIPLQQRKCAALGRALFLMSPRILVGPSHRRLRLRSSDRAAHAQGLQHSVLRMSSLMKSLSRQEASPQIEVRIPVETIKKCQNTYRILGTWMWISEVGISIESRM